MWLLSYVVYIGVVNSRKNERAVVEGLGITTTWIEILRPREQHLKLKCRLDAATLDFLGLEEFVPVNLMELLFSFFGRKPHYTEMKLSMETVIMPVYELPSGRAKNSGRFSLLFMFFGHLRKWLKRIEDIDEEKKEKKLNP